MNVDKQSIYTVAELAGCSPSTVSRMLNGSDRVKLKTRERILAAMRELKFTSRKRVPQIGLLVTGLSGATMISYVSQMVRLVLFELSKYNFMVRYIDGDGPEAISLDDFDAIVSLAYNTKVEALAAQVRSPIVSLNFPIRRPGAFPILSDHRQSARIATEYLLTMGHRKIMLLGFQGDGWGCRERVTAFLETMRTCRGAEPQTGFTREEPLDNIFLRMRQSGCTALINFAEDVLMRVPFQLTHVMKLRIPEELSLISEDLPGVSPFGIPPLTAVHQPLDKLVLKGVETLGRILHGEPVSETPVVFDNELIIRDSVRRLVQ